MWVSRSRPHVGVPTATGAEKFMYKDSPKGNAHLTSLRRMLKKKAGISLGRLAHHYKQCIDAMEQSVWADCTSRVCHPCKPFSKSGRWSGVR